MAELSALFAAADEDDYEDSDDTGVLPNDEVKVLRAELKEAKAQYRLAKKEGSKGDWESYVEQATEMERRLARHKELEGEARQLKADLRANENKQEDLVAAAREQIAHDEAAVVILERLHRLLVQTYSGYLRADQHECVISLENLYTKYAVTAQMIESRRYAGVMKMKSFLTELGYE